jgi:hypothetical protein
VAALSKRLASNIPFQLMKKLTFLLLALLPSLHAEEEAPVNMQHVRAASTWLQNADPAKRKAAISTFRTMPGKAMTHYQTALKAAIKVHLDRIEQIDKSDNKLAEHDDIARQLAEGRERVMPLIRTDYHKDGKKINTYMKRCPSKNGAVQPQCMNIAFFVAYGTF